MPLDNHARLTAAQKIENASNELMKMQVRVESMRDTLHNNQVPEGQLGHFVRRLKKWEVTLQVDGLVYAANLKKYSNYQPGLMVLHIKCLIYSSVS